MLHPRHHEEARMPLKFFIPSVFLREVFVEPNTAEGRNNQIVVPVVNQQLSSMREEGAVPGGIIWYVRGKPVVHELERGRLNYSIVIFDRAVQVHAGIVIAQSQQNSCSEIPIPWWRCVTPGAGTRGIRRGRLELIHRAARRTVDLPQIAYGCSRRNKIAILFSLRRNDQLESVR